MTFLGLMVSPFQELRPRLRHDAMIARTTAPIMDAASMGVNEQRRIQEQHNGYSRDAICRGARHETRSVQERGEYSAAE
jgi:hypothetical protein